MNEWYAKDISKKRRIVKKLKGNSGVLLSALPYGYMKNPDDPQYWVIDPEAAENVRRIYQMALERDKILIPTPNTGRARA